MSCHFVSGPYENAISLKKWIKLICNCTLRDEILCLRTESHCSYGCYEGEAIYGVFQVSKSGRLVISNFSLAGKEKEFFWNFDIIANATVNE